MPNETYRFRRVKACRIDHSQRGGPRLFRIIEFLMYARNDFGAFGGGFAGPFGISRREESDGAGDRGVRWPGSEARDMARQHNERWRNRLSIAGGNLL